MVEFQFRLSKWDLVITAEEYFEKPYQLGGFGFDIRPVE